MSMMFLSALDAGPLKVTLRRSSDLSWDETGGTPKIEGLVNDVRKFIGDLTTIEGQVNSHRKTSFLFLRSVSDGL